MIEIQKRSKTIKRQG